jgi:hypothetical protein
MDVVHQQQKNLSPSLPKKLKIEEDGNDSNCHTVDGIDSNGHDHIEKRVYFLFHLFDDSKNTMNNKF